MKLAIQRMIQDRDDTECGAPRGPRTFCSQLLDELLVRTYNVVFSCGVSAMTIDSIVFEINHAARANNQQRRNYPANNQSQK
jgi:hypothetical protein